MGQLPRTRTGVGGESRSGSHIAHKVHSKAVLLHLVGKKEKKRGLQLRNALKGVHHASNPFDKARQENVPRKVRHQSMTT